MFAFLQEIIAIAQNEAGPGSGPPIIPAGPAGGAGQGAGGAAGAPPSMGNFITQNLMMVGAIIFIFYFIIFRPQIQQRKRHEARLNQLKKGDRVITAGGVHGTVLGIKDNVAVIKIAESGKGEPIKVEVQKSSLTTIIDPEGAVEAPSNR